jgi:hypothetical protein
MAWLGLGKPIPRVALTAMSSLVRAAGKPRAAQASGVTAPSETPIRGLARLGVTLELKTARDSTPTPVMRSVRWAMGGLLDDFEQLRM